MSQRFNFHLEDAQYEALTAESERTSLSVAELIRRAIDQAFGFDEPRRAPGLQVSVGVWRRPDEAVIGRRAGVRFGRPR